MRDWNPKALETLSKYAWPGNVRELRNVVHRAYVMTEGATIQPDVVKSLLPVGAGPTLQTGAAGSRPEKRPASSKKR